MSNIMIINIISVTAFILIFIYAFYISCIEGFNTNKTNIEVIYFYSDTCPLCKIFVNEKWNKFKEEYSSVYEIKEYEENEIEIEDIEKYSIDGFPTVIIKKGDTFKEYRTNLPISIDKFIEKKYKD